MALTDDNDNIKMIDDTAKVPEGIGFTEDLGFSDITDSAISKAEDQVIPDKLICNEDIKFGDISVENNATSEETKKKRAKAEDKRQADAAYDSEKKEQTYKRLMHLVSKSKFYSKYIIDKMNSSDNTDKNKTPRKRKVKNKKSDENSKPPIKRSTKVPKMNAKYDLKDYISDDMRKKMNRKMNLSSEEIESELNTETDDESDIESVTTTFTHPKYFNGNLFEYQQEGVQWLKSLYDNGLNGILADEMGLGKTIQVIALLCALMEEKQAGPYLIIAPLSTIPNWLTEFEKFAPTLPVVMLYGTREEREKIKKKIKIKYPAGDDGFKTQPIILTTYETILFERKLSIHKWRYIIIDEGHRIKNHECQLRGVLETHKSLHRLLLTGTPLQNNLEELWSLLHFLLPDIFYDLEVFRSWFDAKEMQDDEGTRRFIQQEKEKQVISSLREILKPFMLRRDKQDVNLNIPPKKEIIVYAPITELQRELYTATLNRDYDTMVKVDCTTVIVDDESGVRPKRKCLSRHKYSSIYQNIHEIRERNLNDSNSTFDVDEDSRDYKKPQLMDKTNHENIGEKLSTEQKFLNTWKQYTNVTDRNRDFLIHLTFQRPLSMYKLIVNHPYLVHCPLNDAGLPCIDDNLINASGKLLVLDAMLKKLHARGHKVLLFSTMTKVLDVIGDYLTLRPWKYVMLDGRTQISHRKTSIEQFNNDPSIFLFLISTRAGGVGLNLAAADTVIIFDSDWNPQVDLQAMARCHRIGQTQPVVVYRLCTKGTIDEAIIRRAEVKRKLEKMVISKNISFNLKTAQGIWELKKLLESSDSEVAKSKQEVFTDAELDKLLDRSDLLKSYQPTINAELGSYIRNNKK